ncbi:glycosyltransferase family 2 protein [Lachnospiraceae bacterium OttesenSCG-928-D06]|nr:glycosyltransferase family 2 protein [Lachnospiraceae bacterium OttesenSCG-928-D06]
MKKITVVIPNYNGIKFIDGCLSSLKEERKDCSTESSDSLFSVTVVDNGSSDGSVEQIEKEHPWVHLIKLTTNTGFCHGVNVGIEDADTPYIILLNNDTEVKRGFIKNLYKAIEKDENIFSVSSQMLMWQEEQLIDDAGDRYCVLGYAYARGNGKNLQLFNKAEKVFAACGGAAIYRKSIMEEIGFFDEAHFAYMEDIDIGYRARIHGYSNYYEPTAQVRHAGSATSGSKYNPFKTSHSAANNIYMIWKNMPLFQLLLNFPFLFFGFFIKYLYFIRKKMGMIYLRGLGTGIKKCMAKENRGKKVRFQKKNMKNYLKIQLELYINTFLFVLKK